MSTIREKLEDREKLYLSPHAALSSQSKGRQHPEAEDAYRMTFQHDRDRIIHCKSFRRLKHKTQVFLSPSGDHYRTRLTHTLEVSQIARTIAKSLRLNEDLTEAIALGHDLGHTSFGHAGEAVLNEIYPDGFRHPEQSLRVVDVLEKDGKGLNLTYEVRDGILKHSKGEGDIVVIEGDDVHDEIRQVVEKIADLKIKDKEADWNDFAVLVRANDSAKEICATLEAAGLPYFFMASRGLYVKGVILDIISYFKLLDNYHESAAVYRVLNMGIFKFSHQEIVDFNYAARKKAWSLFSVLKDAGSRFNNETSQKINVLLNLVNKHTALARRGNTSEVFMSFLNDSGFLKDIIKEKEQASREKINYLNQFKKRIDRFEAGSDDRTIKAFLEEIEAEIEAGEEGSIAPDMESGPEAI